MKHKGSGWVESAPYAGDPGGTEAGQGDGRTQVGHPLPHRRAQHLFGAVQVHPAAEQALRHERDLDHGHRHLAVLRRGAEDGHREGLLLLQTLRRQKQ
eukprot:3669143-Pyramimonas_sp.AAC.1